MQILLVYIFITFNLFFLKKVKSRIKMENKNMKEPQG